jgi:hypothetical protein
VYAHPFVIHLVAAPESPWAILGDIGTAILALVTVLLAAFGFRQVRLTEQALAQASQDNQEAIKARIDQRAPLVAVKAEATSMSTAHWNRNTPTPVQLEPGDPVDIDQEVGIAGWFTIFNEGSTTALISVPPGVEVLSTWVDRPSLNNVNRPRSETAAELRLAPGVQHLLFVQFAMTVADWGSLVDTPMDERSPQFVILKVTDTFSEGIEDSLRLRFSGVPVHRDGGAWVGGPASSGDVTGIAVEKTIRQYPSLAVVPSGRRRSSKA